MNNSVIFTCAVCHVRRTNCVLELEDSKCCTICVQDNKGLGKFEGNDPESLATCLILYAWSQMGEEDDFMANEGWGYCARFGKYLLMEDTQGFVTYEEFDSEEKAMKRYNDIYEDGMGASDDDGYIFHEWNRGWQASFNGKPLDIWAPRHTDNITRTRALARIRLEMIRTGFYPNVWEESDHGNLRLVKNL